MDDSPIRSKTSELLKAATKSGADGTPSMVHNMATALFKVTMEMASDAQKAKTAPLETTAILYALCESIAQTTSVLMVQGQIQSKILSAVVDSLPKELWPKVMDSIAKLTPEDVFRDPTKASK